jgi:phospholipase/lecithinase/hemolysin
VGGKNVSRIRDIFFFGDSYTDGGVGAHGIYEISGHTTPLSPPYFNGQWCDGPVWVEQFARKLDVCYSPSHNFAVGGATIGTSNVAEVGYEALRGTGMLAQVQRYVARIPSVDPSALHVLWAGGNDINDQNIPAEEIVPRALANMRQCVRLLISAGARFVLVVTSPNVGCSPRARMQGKVDLWDQLSRELRSGVVRMVQELGSQLPTTVILGDAFELHEEVMNHPARYVLTNVMDVCVLWDSSEVVGDASVHLYWDDAHFTAAFHALVADRLYAAVCEGLG